MSEKLGSLGTGKSMAEYDAAYREVVRLDREAYELSKKLEATEAFSAEWSAVIVEIEDWTKLHGRPLYVTYNE